MLGFVPSLLLALAPQGTTPAIEQLRAGVTAAEAAVRASRLPDARRATRSAWQIAEALADERGTDAAQDLLWRLGKAASRAEDVRTEHDAFAAVTAHRERTLPDDDIELQRARGNLANAKHGMGDLEGALVLKEKVLAAFLKTLPDEHRYVQMARNNLAVTKGEMGDLEGARALQEKVLEVRSRTLPEDHPALQRARGGLAATLLGLGDVRRALTLAEKVLAVFSRSLRDGDLELEKARQTLGAARSAIGDRSGALALLEQALAGYSRSLPDDHIDLQKVRVSLANVKRNLGDVDGAMALEDRALDVLTGKLPDDHPYLQSLRVNLALSRTERGDHRGAIELMEAAHAICQATVSEDDPELQLIRSNLAMLHMRAGAFGEVLKLLRKAFEAQSVLLPDDHPALQRTRLRLAIEHARRGTASKVRALMVAVVQAWRRSLATSPLSPRALSGTAELTRGHIDYLASFVQGCGALPPMPDLAASLLLLHESVRGVETRSARRLRTGLAAEDRARATQLRHDLDRVVRELAALEHTPTGSAERRSRRFAAVQRRDELQRSLLALVRGARGTDDATLTTADLAAHLPEGAAAVTILPYIHYTIDREGPLPMRGERRVLALCLDRSGEVQPVPLPSLVEVEDLVLKLRAAVDAGAAPVRGRRAGRRPAPSEDLAVHRRLRQRLVDPVLAALPDAHRIYASLHESCQLVPLDALPDAKGKLVGEAVQIRSLVSLLDLAETAPAPRPHEAPRLVAFGGIRYDQPAQKVEVPDLHAASPVSETERPGERRRYPFLGGTAKEVERVAALFTKLHPGAGASVHTGDGCGKATLFATAPGADYVHLATHGYFAPEWVRSPGSSTEDPLRRRRGATGLSPLALCGLALSGADLPPDDNGHHPGIVTAEELLQLDLSRSALVTLSACDAALGVRRTSQGYASLRAALLGAGARYVVASLWEVGDAATAELMVDVYRRLWEEKKDPHRALWEARLAARDRGATFRDWAGWVLTGR